MTPELRTVVLDDDPTGIQTVHGCRIITRWDPETVRSALCDEVPFFFVLTNTRALTPDAARAKIAEIAGTVLVEAKKLGVRAVFVSRSDSTLRSHFPLECNVIRAAMLDAERAGAKEQTDIDALFLVPAFFEGGRVTRNDVHLIRMQNEWIPTDRTEFAKDSVFGYSSSHLPSYIQEKAGIDASAVLSLSLETIRTTEPEALVDQLCSLRNGRYVVVNAESYADLERFCLAARAALGAGKRFLFQTAASFVKAFTATPDVGLLGSGVSMDPRTHPRGLIVVGSHVQKSSEQLACLLQEPEVRGVEIDVQRVLEDGPPYLTRMVTEIECIWNEGVTPVVFTSRAELPFPTTGERLEAGQRVSRFLSSMVRVVRLPLRFLISKGGITSHDLLVDGLELSSARVLGQIAPGVPVIRIPEGHRLAGVPYVIFPGNVGGATTLREVFHTLSDVE